MTSPRPWLLPRVWAGGLLLLMSATWPLWFPGLLGFPGPAPRIPLIPLLPVLASDSNLVWGLAHAVSTVLMAGLILVIVFPRRFRWLWWVIASCLVLSFLLDQHRLQPWAYQSAIYAMIFACMDRFTARRWMIPLAASVYLYSAAGKFDYQFVHTVGQDFLKAATDPFGGLPGGVTETTRTRLALLFPMVESIAGLGILFPRTRRASAMLVIAMHLGLLAILGPWNRDHSHGVLLWNVLLIAQAYLLLIRAPEPDETTESLPAVTGNDSPVSALPRLLVQLVVILAVAAPLLERSGYWDHWTSWSLYSPHTSHVDVEIHQTAINQLSESLARSLDEDLARFFDEDRDGDGWQLLDLAQWSLATRRVPVYPQARYQLALAAEIADRAELTDGIRARLVGPSDRRTGQRSERLMRDRKEIREGLQEFWLRPR